MYVLESSSVILSMFCAVQNIPPAMTPSDVTTTRERRKPKHPARPEKRESGVHSMPSSYVPTCLEDIVFVVYLDEKKKKLGHPDQKDLI